MVMNRYYFHRIRETRILGSELVVTVVKSVEIFVSDLSRASDTTFRCRIKPIHPQVMCLEVEIRCGSSKTRNVGFATISKEEPVVTCIMVPWHCYESGSTIDSRTARLNLLQVSSRRLKQTSIVAVTNITRTNN
jgi:hypothetical protein